MSTWRRLVVAACVTAFAGCTPAKKSAAPETATIAFADLDKAVETFDSTALKAKLSAMPAGMDRDYFEGILASRLGRSDEAIALLTRVLPTLRTAQPRRAAQALDAVANASAMAYRYADAARAYDEIEQHFADHLGHSVSNDAALMRILVGVPAQTVAWQGPVRLKASRSPLGVPVVNITVNGVRAQWLVDTGANYSVVSQSFAKRLGLSPLAGTASVGSGLTGMQNPLRAAIVPALVLGGATLNNVVVMILADDNLRIGPKGAGYQIHAVLGFPVLKALGSVTFTQDEFLAGSSASAATSGVPMYLRGLTPVIECEIDGGRLLFTFDTGASSTDFSVRYFERFRDRDRTWQTRRVESGGAGGSVVQNVRVQPLAAIKVGSATSVLKDVSIQSTRMNAGIDILFGNLGEDFVSDFKSFTLDFTSMTFSLGPALQRK